MVRFFKKKTMREIALWFFRRSLNEEERAERRKWYENPGTTCGEDVIISEPGVDMFEIQF